MVSVKPAPRAEPALCPGGAKIKPPFEMGVGNFDKKYSEIAFLQFRCIFTILLI